MDAEQNVLQGALPPDLHYSEPFCDGLVPRCLLDIRSQLNDASLRKPKAGVNNLSWYELSVKLPETSHCRGAGFNK